MWWLIWIPIILGTVLVAVLLVRTFLRSGRAFLAQLEETTNLTHELDRLVSELEEAQQRAQNEEFSPHILASDEQRLQWRNQREQIKAHKAQRREARLDRTLDRWREIGIPL